MRLEFNARMKVAAAVASAMIVGTSGLGQAQQEKRKKDVPVATKEEAAEPEKIEGVIVKAEKVGVETKAGGAKGKVRKSLRLSINTNAVWRDWARDQAQASDVGSPKKDAAKGANSIATKGQPVDENSLVVVEVAPGTKLETRFRSPTDETTKGAATPAKVEPDSSASAKVAAAGKPVEFRAEDLAPGLFVEAELKPSESKDKNSAATLTVIRPIRPLSPSTPAQPAPK